MYTDIVFGKWTQWHDERRLQTVFTLFGYLLDCRILSLPQISFLNKNASEFIFQTHDDPLFRNNDGQLGYGASFQNGISRSAENAVNDMLARISFHADKLKNLPVCSKAKFEEYAQDYRDKKALIRATSAWATAIEDPDFDTIFPQDEISRAYPIIFNGSLREQTMRLVELERMFTSRKEAFESRRRQEPGYILHAPMGLMANVWTAFDRSNTADPCTCCVCHDETDADSTSSIVQLFCGHSFHEHCAEPWFKTRATCPTCRAQFQTRDLEFNRKYESDMVLEPTRSTKRRRGAEDQQ
jgi:hypothetical protein